MGRLRPPLPPCIWLEDCIWICFGFFWLSFHTVTYSVCYDIGTEKVLPKVILISCHNIWLMKVLSEMWFIKRKILICLCMQADLLNAVMGFITTGYASMQQDPLQPFFLPVRILQGAVCSRQHLWDIWIYNGSRGGPVLPVAQHASWRYWQIVAWKCRWLVQGRLKKCNQFCIRNNSLSVKKYINKKSTPSFENVGEGVFMTSSMFPYINNAGAELKFSQP